MQCVGELCRSWEREREREREIKKKKKKMCERGGEVRKEHGERGEKQLVSERERQRQRERKCEKNRWMGHGLERGQVGEGELKQKESGREREVRGCCHLG